MTGLYGCLLRAVRTGVPYGCQKSTLMGRQYRPCGRTKWHPYVWTMRTVDPYGPYVRVACIDLNSSVV